MDKNAMDKNDVMDENIIDFFGVPDPMHHEFGVAGLHDAYGVGQSMNNAASGFYNAAAPQITPNLAQFQMETGVEMGKDAASGIYDADVFKTDSSMSSHASGGIYQSQHFNNTENYLPGNNYLDPFAHHNMGALQPYSAGDFTGTFYTKDRGFAPKQSPVPHHQTGAFGIYSEAQRASAMASSLDDVHHANPAAGHGGNHQPQNTDTSTSSSHSFDSGASGLKANDPTQSAGGFHVRRQRYAQAFVDPFAYHPVKIPEEPEDGYQHFHPLTGNPARRLVPHEKKLLGEFFKIVNPDIELPHPYQLEEWRLHLGADAMDEMWDYIRANQTPRDAQERQISLEANRLVTYELRQQEIRDHKKAQNERIANTVLTKDPTPRPRQRQQMLGGGSPIPKDSLDPIQDLLDWSALPDADPNFYSSNSGKTSSSVPRSSIPGKNFRGNDNKESAPAMGTRAKTRGTTPAKSTPLKNSYTPGDDDGNTEDTDTDVYQQSELNDNDEDEDEV